MDEYITWSDELKQFGDNITLKELLKDVCETWDVYEVEEGKYFRNIGLKDINGKNIYADCSIVELEHKYSQRSKKENGIYTLENFHTQKTEILQGCFVWNNDELKYEINILNHDFFICLDFINSMKNFKIIDTIQENKLGLIK